MSKFSIKKITFVSINSICHMNYACSSWYHGLQKNLKHKLQILQNKTIRFVLDLTPRSHIGYSEFNRVNWLPVRFRVQQIVSTSMHRLIHGNPPPWSRNDTPITPEIVFSLWSYLGSTVRETNIVLIHCC